MKRSAETGFSVSNTRPIGPPTMSQSDERERARAASAAMRAKSPAPGSAGARRYQTQAAMEAAAANGRATSAGQAQQPQQVKNFLRVLKISPSNIFSIENMYKWLKKCSNVRRI